MKTSLRHLKDHLVSSGVRTHAPLRRPELESGALDHSAMLTWLTSIFIRIYLSISLEAEKHNLRSESVSSHVRCRPLESGGQAAYVELTLPCT
jgi:hypothetical protein